METVIQQAGEWLDKEPRADGKPRRWRPFEELTIDQGRVFILLPSAGLIAGTGMAYVGKHFDSLYK